MKSEAVSLAHKTGAVGSKGQELRAVGQGLESLNVEDFDLTAEDEGYFALATRRIPNQTRKAGVTTAIRLTWQKLSSHNRPIEERPDVLRVVFSREGILRLERIGRERRKADARGLPDLTKLAQLLRIVGERLDELSSRLVKVSKRGDKIVVEYASAANRRRNEEWKLSELYDLWLEACQRRDGRTSVIEQELYQKAK